MEIKLNTMFFVEQSSYPIEEMPRNEINGDQQQLIDDGMIKDTVSLTNDANLLLTHRSLFILKKKFETFKKEIKKVYKKYSEESIDDHLIDVNNFIRLTVEVMTKAKFMLVKIKDFNELTQKEIRFVNNVVLDMDLMDQLNVFITHERRKYNVIYRDKRMKVKFTLDDYKDYVPIGNDDLTKIYTEEIEVDNDENNNNDNNNQDEENDNKSQMEINSNSLEQLKEQSDKGNNDNKDQKKQINTPNEDNNRNIKNKANQKDNISLISKDPNTPISVPIEKRSDNNSINNNSVLAHSEQQRGKQTNNKKKIKRTYQKNFLFIETLPLILADFLSTSPDYAICDLNDDIRSSLRTLFDNEILQRLGEETSAEINRNKIEKLKDLLFTQANIEKNIQFYEQLLYKTKAEKGNSAFIEVTLSKLNDNKKWLDDKIKRIQDDNNTFNEYENALYEQEQKEREMIIAGKRKNAKSNILLQPLTNIRKDNHQSQNNIQQQSINSNNQSSIMNEQSISMISNPLNSNDSNNRSLISNKKSILKPVLSKEEIRLNSLKEIFYFYSRQHSTIGKQSTFDSLKSKMDHLDLSEFSKFCVEFKILITKDKLVELFKKNTSNTKQMSFEEFSITLQKISLVINEEKKKVMKKRIIQLRTILERNKQIQQDYLQNDPNFNANKEIENENANDNQKEENKFPSLPNPLSNNISLLKENQIKEEITTCKADLDKLNKKTYQQLLDELFLYMDLDQEILYRDKMKGFNLPFLNKTKRLIETLPPLKTKISKTVDKRTAKEIHQMIEDRKRELQEQKALETRLKGMELAYQKKYLLGNLNNRIANQTSEKKKGVVLTVKHQKEIRELQRKKKDNDQKEFNKKVKRVYLKAQKDQKAKEGEDEIDALMIERDEEDEDNIDQAKTIEEKQKEEVDRLLRMKNVAQVGNKFTWDAIENLKPLHLVKQEEMIKYLK